MEEFGQEEIEDRDQKYEGEEITDGETYLNVPPPNPWGAAAP